MTQEYGHPKIIGLIIMNLVMKERNPPDVWGWTPLHWAAKRGDVDICKLIMDAVYDHNPSHSRGKNRQD